MKNNSFKSLFSKRLALIPFKKTSFICFGIFLGLFLIIDLSMIIVLKSNAFPEDKRNLINVFFIVNTIILAIYAIIVNLWLFRIEADEKIINLDEHYGYQTRNIFLVRLIEALFWVITFLVLATIINLIIIGSARGFNNSYYYRAYLISLGWYSLVMFGFTSLTIFIASFLKVIWSLILVILLLFSFLAIANYGGLVMNGSITKIDTKTKIGELLRTRNDYSSVYEESTISRKYTFLNKEYNELTSEWLDFEEDVNSLGEGNFNNGWLQSSGGKKLINAYVEQLTSPSHEVPNPLDDEKYSAITNFYNFFDNFFTVNAAHFKSFSAKDLQIDNITKSESTIRLLKKVQSFDLGKYKKVVDFFVKEYQDVAISSSPGFWDLKDLTLLCEKLANGTISYAEVLFYGVMGRDFDKVMTKVTVYPNLSYDPTITDHLVFNKFAIKTAKSAIYNPLMQLSLMFNGVNYTDLPGYDSVFSGAPPVLATNKYAYAPDGWKDITVHRVVKVEAIYIGYLIFFGLLIFASYWIFRSKIK